MELYDQIQAVVSQALASLRNLAVPILHLIRVMAPEYKAILAAMALNLLAQPMVTLAINQVQVLYLPL